MSFHISRRNFIKSAAVFSAIGLAPNFLTRSAHAAPGTIEGFRDDRVLVVIQLAGGNDGLNTVVPYGDDAYYRARPNLGLRKNRILPIDDHFALNDKLRGLMELYDDGKVAGIHGVGYPNPDRSHFRSMEIWETASDSDEYLGTGWIGRYFDNYCSGAARPQAGVAIAKERPQAFDGDKGYGIAFEHPKGFGWKAGQGADGPENFRRINSGGSPNDTLDFLRHTTSNAIMSASEVQRAAETARADLKPNQPLQTVAALIRGGLETCIYYVPFSGFDTHASQSGQHDNLLERFGDQLHTFQKTLERDGTSGRVMTMVFSEFGRRVAENGSGGTDHGTAAPMFLAGDAVRAGFHGTAPSLNNLNNGDLKHTTDFRSVYASVLERWFDVASANVLQGAYTPLDVIRA